MFNGSGICGALVKTYYYIPSGFISHQSGRDRRYGWALPNIPGAPLFQKIAGAQALFRTLEFLPLPERRLLWQYGITRSPFYARQLNDRMIFPDVISREPGRDPDRCLHR